MYFKVNKKGYTRKEVVPNRFMHLTVPAGSGSSSFLA